MLSIGSVLVERNFHLCRRPIYWILGRARLCMYVLEAARTASRTACSSREVDNLPCGLRQKWMDFASTYNHTCMYNGDLYNLDTVSQFYNYNRNEPGKSGHLYNQDTYFSLVWSLRCPDYTYRFHCSHLYISYCRLNLNILNNFHKLVLLLLISAIQCSSSSDSCTINHFVLLLMIWLFFRPRAIQLFNQESKKISSLILQCMRVYGTVVVLVGV